ncbi:MAG: ribosome recycling factor [Bacteroidales bacterium]
MNEEVQFLLEETEEKMQNAVNHLDGELRRLRAGKANPYMLDGIKVDYYGVLTPLNQVSNVSTTDAKTIVVQPWEKSMIEPIEKAIMYANLGLNPVNNGELIRINVPPLTEERRRDLLKQVKAECESAKVSIRTARRDANDELKKMMKEGLEEDMEKDAEDSVQKLTDKYSGQVDELYTKKEADIMTI